MKVQQLINFNLKSLNIKSVIVCSSLVIFLVGFFRGLELAVWELVLCKVLAELVEAVDGPKG